MAAKQLAIVGPTPPRHAGDVSPGPEVVAGQGSEGDNHLAAGVLALDVRVRLLDLPRAPLKVSLRAPVRLGLCMRSAGPRRRLLPPKAAFSLSQAEGARRPKVRARAPCRAPRFRALSVLRGGAQSPCAQEACAAGRLVCHAVPASARRRHDTGALPPMESTHAHGARGLALSSGSRCATLRRYLPLAMSLATSASCAPSACEHMTLQAERPKSRLAAGNRAQPSRGLGCARTCARCARLRPHKHTRTARLLTIQQKFRARRSWHHTHVPCSRLGARCSRARRSR